MKTRSKQIIPQAYTFPGTVIKTLNRLNSFVDLENKFSAAVSLNQKVNATKQDCPIFVSNASVRESIAKPCTAPAPDINNA
jgi:hypothetical protein